MKGGRGTLTFPVLTGTGKADKLIVLALISNRKKKKGQATDRNNNSL
jgi:hypothetical protein